MELGENTSSFEPIHPDMDGFELGNPVLVCRWRLSNRALPLANRHLRALANRRVNNSELNREVVAWAKQHIEWTLKEGSAAHPNGVLMFVLDESGCAAMTVGEYEALEDSSTLTLIQRAKDSMLEAKTTGISPETLWLYTNERYYTGLDESDKSSGSTTFITQFAQTLGIPVLRDASLLARAEQLDPSDGLIFLVSDEHGVVLPDDYINVEDPPPEYEHALTQVTRLKEGYETLLAKS